MAGTVTQTRTTNPGKIKFERIITLACLSDAADGTVPDTTLSGLNKFQLEEIITTPGTGAAIPTAEYRVYITQAGARFFLGGARAVDAAEVQGGHEDAGYYRPVDGDLVVRVAATNALTAANIGTANTTTIKLRFKLRGM